MTPLQTAQVVAAVHHLPSLPAVVVELLESVDREDVNADCAVSERSNENEAVSGAAGLLEFSAVLSAASLRSIASAAA